MREPIYKSRPVAPNAARLGGERVADAIVMSEGCSNVYLLETDDGGVLVNAGMAFEAPVHHRNLSDLSKVADDLRIVVTTQGHVDHVGGVEFFRRRNPGLQYVAQANNPEHQAYENRLMAYRGARSAFRFAARFREDARYYAEHGFDLRVPHEAPTPDLLFEDRHAFSQGGLDVELIAVPGAETNDSLVVWLPEERICLTGNLFGCPFGHFPNLVTIRGDRYRDALVCAEAAQTVLDLAPETILYGHHAPVRGADVIREELTVYRDAIHFVHDAVVEGMNAGRSVHELMAGIALPPELELGEGYGRVAWGVRAIWEHYSGWFHHTSTTELYAVPPSAVHGDLVELAGADALLERARKHLDAGETERALHLLDVLLGVRPDHVPALDLAIAAHTRLLEAADNFWLEGWLEHQIGKLRAARDGDAGC